MIKYLKEREKEREIDYGKNHNNLLQSIIGAFFVHVLNLASNETKRTISVSFYHVFFFKLVCSC